MSQQSNLEESVTISIVTNGTSGALGLIQNIISDAYLQNPSISSGIILGKVTFFAVAADTMSVTIAMQSGDPERTALQATKAMSSILAATFTAVLSDALLAGITTITIAGITVSSRLVKNHI